MFCLMCGSFLAGTAFFMLRGPIFVYTYGGLIRTRFIRTYVYNLAKCSLMHYILIKPNHTTPNAEFTCKENNEAKV